MPLRKPVDSDGPDGGKTVNATEFQKTPGLYQEMTSEGPLTITKYDRPTYVLLSYKDYQKLTKNRIPIRTADAPQEDIDAVLSAKYPKGLDHLNDELKDD